jgi:hypothetical protein
MQICRNAAVLRRALVAVVTIMMPTSLLAQADALEGPQRATRTELMELATKTEQAITNGGIRGDRLKKARLRLTAVQKRLQQGDFRTGDRFVVTLRHEAVQVDTASVRDSLLVTLLALPDLALAGVLRSELDGKINEHVAKYLRNATVRVSTLTRVAVLGAVRSPGFYYAAPDRPMSDVLMLAGGPAPNARLNALTVNRGGVTILDKEASRRAFESGLTLEQLDVQSGDEIRIASARTVRWDLVLRFGLMAVTVFFAAIQFLQWYVNRQDT